MWLSMVLQERKEQTYVPILAVIQLTLSFHITFKTIEINHLEERLKIFSQKLDKTKDFHFPRDREEVF